jgi:hypothetical protein
MAPIFDRFLTSIVSSSEFRIKFFTRFVFAGLLVAVSYHLLLKAAGFKFPWTSFLFYAGDRFNDWHNSVAAAATFNPYYADTRAISAYFPLAYRFFLIAAGFSRDYSTGIFAFISVALLVLAVFSAYRFVRIGGLETRYQSFATVAVVSMSLLLAYPTLFALDRGNIDIWIGCLCVIFVARLNTDREFLGYLSLCIAIALKGYPLAFLLLALARGKYLGAFLCAMSALLLTVVVLAGMTGGFDYNFKGFLNCIRRYHDTYVIDRHSLFASADPYNGIRSLILIFGSPDAPVAEWSRRVLRTYSFFSAAFALICSIYVLFSRADYPRKVLAVGLLVLVFPNVANDYKLAVLLPAVLLFLFSSYEACVRAAIIFIILCFLMIPKSYLFFNGIGISNVVEPVLILVVFVILVSDSRAWGGIFPRARFRVSE